MAYKKKWQKKEKEVREQMRKEEQLNKKMSYTQSLTSSSKNKVNQIFSSSGASGVLMNDLLSIMEHSNDLV